MVGCDAFNSQPCQGSYGGGQIKLSFVPCCRYCDRFDSCKLFKCLNNPDKCGKVVFDFVKQINRRNGRRVAKVDRVSGEILEVYDFIKDASEVVGVSMSAIGQVCRGEKITAGGYKWRYVE